MSETSSITQLPNRGPITKYVNIYFNYLVNTKSRASADKYLMTKVPHQLRDQVKQEVLRRLKENDG